MAGERGASSSQFVEQPAVTSGMPPLWAESRALLEFYSLFYSPVYYGCGVPKGDGKHIFVLPGMSGSDGYLLLMRNWLNRMGYNSHESGIGINEGDVLTKTSHVTESMERVVGKTGKPIAIIGHSLGGVEGLHIAHLRPDLVDTVVTMGSPIHGNPVKSVHPLVAEYGAKHIAVSPQLIEDYMQVSRLYPLHPDVELYNIYSKTDGVVNWQACAHPEATEHLQVYGSHTGMAFNAQVYWHLAQILAGKHSQQQKSGSLQLVA